MNAIGTARCPKHYTQRVGICLIQLLVSDADPLSQPLPLSASRWQSADAFNRCLRIEGVFDEECSDKGSDPLPKSWQLAGCQVMRLDWSVQHQRH